MCIRDRRNLHAIDGGWNFSAEIKLSALMNPDIHFSEYHIPVSYTHLRAHETVLDLVCRLLLEKKKR